MPPKPPPVPHWCRAKFPPCPPWPFPCPPYMYMWPPMPAMHFPPPPVPPPPAGPPPPGPPPGPPPPKSGHKDYPGYPTKVQAATPPPTGPAPPPPPPPVEPVEPSETVPSNFQRSGQPYRVGQDEMFQGRLNPNDPTRQKGQSNCTRLALYPYRILIPQVCSRRCYKGL